MKNEKMIIFCKTDERQKQMSLATHLIQEEATKLQLYMNYHDTNETTGATS